jgi:HK97 family phage major capsid protein
MSTRDELNDQIRRADAAARQVVKRMQGIDPEDWGSTSTDEFDQAIEAEKAARLGLLVLDDEQRATAKANAATRAQSIEAEKRATAAHDFTQRTILSSSGGALRTAALRAIEARSAGLTAHQADYVADLVNSGRVDISRAIVATEDEDYRSGWVRSLAYRGGFSDAELAAASRRESIAEGRESRAASEGTNTAGGYATLWYLDPAIIPTAGGLVAPILDMCRTDTMTSGSTWHGVVSSQDTAYAWTAESAAMADSALTLSQISLPVYKGAAAIPMSRELFEDLAGGGTEEFAAILQQSYRSFQGNQTINGTGSSAPYGIIPTLVATTGSRVTVAASGSVTSADVEKTYQALPDKFRQNAAWFMHPTTLTKIRQSLTAGPLSVYSDNSDAGPQLVGLPVVTSQYFTAFSGTTGNTVYAALVDVADGFEMALRAPSLLEVTDAYDQSTGRPSYSKFLISSVRTAQGLLSPNFGVALTNY